jgi:hypothetical protein
MTYRVIHLIDAEAGNYQWPFKLGEWVWSKSHRIAATVVGGWFELRSLGRRQDRAPETREPSGVQVFYRVETADGREFTEPAQDLEPRRREQL